MTHPLAGFDIRINNLKGFGEASETVELHPINILIGKNNTGKSTFLDALQLFATAGKYYNTELDRSGHSWSIEIGQQLNETTLQQVFRPGVRGGGIHVRDHWEYGHRFIDQRLVTLFQNRLDAAWHEGPVLTDLSDEIRSQNERKIVEAVPRPLPNGQIVSVSAERNVKPEERKEEWEVHPDGEGLTNAIRAFLNEDRLPREQVDENLLAALNEIYEGDNQFLRILTRENEQNFWEIFLEEEDKGLIRLSRSGSSLKSIFTILAAIQLNPITRKSNLNQSVIFIEEPENNLHPALLRRLLDYLTEVRDNHSLTLFVTTHSPVCIDWASRREDTGVIHVAKTDDGARASPAISYESTRQILDELDYRASELLQANGIIWVEGPSDRIYIRAWIDLLSEGRLEEGRHYTIMFYGGRLLNHLSAEDPEADSSAISLLRINKNLAIVIDSDRKWLDEKKTRARADINKTKQRLKQEANSLGGFEWITDGKEIENYLSPRNIGAALERAALSVDKYSSVFSKSATKKFKNRKVIFAERIVTEMEPSDLDTLDLRKKIEALVLRIELWNGLR